LWGVNGEIIDARYTRQNDADDIIWKGIDRIRERYINEFSQRTYHSLIHKNISILVEGDKATVVNDLSAEFSDGGKHKQIFLADGDRWELQKINGRWKIVKLSLNRISR